MAECNLSIDKNNLPGVKEVCRDFAVLEDRCLAYNLQEQEIESHLAHNVNKSKLVQKDLQVAKKLQEEEDQWAKVQSQKQHSELALQDNEIAQGIQEELIRQAEQQRQQEEKDAAIARKLQEKEMKEERRRQKQLEATFEEDYFEDHGARGPLDMDKQGRHKSTSPGRYDAYAPISSHRDYSPEYNSKEPKRNRHPRQDPAAPQSHSRHPEQYLVAEGGRSRYADPYPEHLLPSRGKRGDKYINNDPSENDRDKGHWEEDTERVVRKKEKPARPPPPLESTTERDKAWDRGRDRQYYQDRGRDPQGERDFAKEQRRNREQDHLRVRERGRDRERSRDRQRQRDKERVQVGTRNREKELDKELEHSRDCLRADRASWEEQGDDDGERERKARGRQRVQSGPEDGFDELRSDEGTGDSRESWDRKRAHSQSNEEPGRVVHRGSGAVVAETEYGVSEATKGMTKLELREQELKDMEVARRMQEEEMKASKMHVHAAQVAQDEEIARLMMEQEKREYKKIREREHEREREKEREREREKLAMERTERKRQEGYYRPHSEDVVRPRTRDEYEHQRQKNHNKPARPPQPRAHDYENVTSGHSDHPVPAQAPTRPEAAYKGAYYKR